MNYTHLANQFATRLVRFDLLKLLNLKNLSEFYCYLFIMQINTTQIDIVPGIQYRIPANKMLSLYQTAPSQEISLDEFELFALDRFSTFSYRKLYLTYFQIAATAWYRKSENTRIRGIRFEYQDASGNT